MAKDKYKIYQERRAALRTRTTQESMTDQSAAATTDINVVVGYMLKTGQPPAEKQPIYGDFTQFPEDLRGFIETARSLGARRRKLPPQLRNMPVSDLLALTPDKLAEILKPPAPQPDKKPEEGTK